MPCTLSRRSFLGRTAAGSAAVGVMSPSGLTRVAFAQGATDHTLVVVFLFGGVDALSTVVPVGEGRTFYDQRPSIAVPENRVLDLDGFFGFHPVMGPLHELYQSGDLAVITAVGGADETRSHFQSRSFIDNGVAGDSRVNTGWLGRHLATVGTPSPFSAMGIDFVAPAAFIGANSLTVPRLGDFAIAPASYSGSRARAQATIGRMYATSGADPRPIEDAGTEALQAINLLASADIGPDDRPDAYGPGRTGGSLHEASRIINADLGASAVYLDGDGLDPHDNLGTFDQGDMREQLNGVSRGLRAFYDDLGANRSKVTTVVMSEFGRIVYENASAGTDHGRGGVAFVLGEGVRGGQIHGTWPGVSEAQQDDGALRVTTDIRQILAEVIDRRLGNRANLPTVFPNWNYNSANNLSLFT